MAANRYERGELFGRLHLQNRQNGDEIGRANLSVESDSQTNQRNQTDVFTETTTLRTFKTERKISKKDSFETKWVFSPGQKSDQHVGRLNAKVYNQRTNLAWFTPCN